MSGGNTGPIVDTWWQTETGAIMISPLPGITATKPGSAMAPLPGISAKIVDDDANELGAGGSGYLVLDKPVTLFTVLHRRATVARPGMTPCPCLTHDPGGGVAGCGGVDGPLIDLRSCYRVKRRQALTLFRDREML
ncbi:hypothetical protein W59_02286 [Rhodococcus opacus RKJ300 = JCM 13270]|uniref:AMP-dependent synthetase/ligase domain-containing protein n=1 Tax=Rhodococcus opacus RKJ300 = JCM 13270 TaxID=1165867 RepID=I0WYT6_RHOOP|nr:hypothetical protein W59_02286 [Rhodococcus opacus RKJ300 = JCM 13270]QQZ19633.1 AMP-binding protein [Rhodococcus sp. 21391]